MHQRLLYHSVGKGVKLLRVEYISDEMLCKRSNGEKKS